MTHRPICAHRRKSSGQSEREALFQLRSQQRRRRGLLRRLQLLPGMGRGPADRNSGRRPTSADPAAPESVSPPPAVGARPQRPPRRRQHRRRRPPRLNPPAHRSPPVRGADLTTSARSATPPPPPSSHLTNRRRQHRGSTGTSSTADQPRPAVRHDPAATPAPPQPRRRGSRQRSPRTDPDDFAPRAAAGQPGPGRAEPGPGAGRRQGSRRSGAGRWTAPGPGSINARSAWPSSASSSAARARWSTRCCRRRSARSTPTRSRSSRPSSGTAKPPVPRPISRPPDRTASR